MPLKHFHCALLLMFAGVSAAAQPMPIAQRTSLRALSEIHTRVVEPLDLQAIAAEDAADPQREQAPRFALPRPVDITTRNAGTWEVAADGRHVWRYRVRSELAASFNFGFTTYHMPPGGELWVYSPDFSSRFGPYTDANNHEHRQLWTPVVIGDDAVVELSLPADEVKNLQLHLTQIGQGYRGFGARDLLPGPGCKPGAGEDGANRDLRSGSCNMDVACLGTADAWQANRRSVAAQGTGGSRVCTGSLINNVRGDRRMLYITATHCGVTAANAPSLFVYWNFDAPSCRLPGSPESGSGAVIGATNQTQTGATFLAQTNNPFSGSTPAGTRSDVTLVALSTAANPAFNLHWSGWDRRDVAPQCTGTDATSSVTTGLCASIHHPSGDEKRITFVQENMFTDNISGATGVHWRARWDPTPPILPNIPGQPATVVPGVTEPGSSGSPLYDANRRLVGVLSGGPSACGSTGTNLSDLYGKLAHAWEGLGTPTTRVRDHLDPDNTGAMFVDGVNLTAGISLAATPSTPTICAGQTGSTELRVSTTGGASPVTLSVEGQTAGIGAVSFGVNPVTPSAAPGTPTTVNIPIQPGTAPGAQSFTIRGNASPDTFSLLVPVQVVADAAPPAPSLQVPAANATSVALNTGFSWTGSAVRYRFELSRTADFAVLIEDQTVTGTSASLSRALRANASYFWRVTPSNVCAAGTAASGNFQTLAGDTLFTDGFFE